MNLLSYTVLRLLTNAYSHISTTIVKIENISNTQEFSQAPCSQFFPLLSALGKHWSVFYSYSFHSLKSCLFYGKYF